MTDFITEKTQKKQASNWLKLQGKSSKRWVMATVWLGVISGILLILQMYFLSHIAYETYILQAPLETIYLYFLGMIGIIIVRAALAWLRERVSFQASARVRFDVRERIYEHVRQLGPIYASKMNTGEIISAAVEQTEGLNNYFVKYLPQMSIAVFLPIAILMFIFPVSITSGLILLICAPLIPLFMALVGMGAESLHQKNFAQISKMSQFFLDTLQGLVTLKILGKSKQRAEQVFSASDDYRIKTMGVLRIAFLSSAVLEVFAAASIALLAIYLGMGFINTGTDNTMWWGLGGITLQGALFILLLAPEFFLPLRELGTYYHARAEAVGAAMEIQKVLNIKANNIPDNIMAKQVSFAKQNKIELDFNQVQFSYENDANKALSDLSVTINPGEKIALVGESGAGKTTLINLLLRFINTTSGEVKINGVNLYSISENDWYNNVSWLGQNPMLFSATIKDNLLIANQNASDEELWQALEVTHLDEVVRDFPDQLNTKIGENYLGLSGGQAQRLALSRAYLKNTPLLLLDEPTASLDIEHEQLVANTLDELWQGKTVILATHRAYNLKKMDKILVLQDGELRQVGTYQQLISDKNGQFYKSCQLLGLES